MTPTPLLPPRLPLFRYLRRDPQANFLCTFALLIGAVWVVLFFVVDRSDPGDYLGFLFSTAAIALFVLIPVVIAFLRWRRQARIGSIGVRTTARVSFVHIGRRKNSSSYVILDYVFEGQPQRWKYVTITTPGLALGDSLDLFVDPDRPQRVAPVSLFVLDAEDPEK